MPKKKLVIIAEFSIHPIGSGTSVGRYVKGAVDALSRLPGLKYQTTPMATVLEAEELSTILRAVEVAHMTLRSMGAKRISSMLRVDQRLDKPRTMVDKVRSIQS
ncbi:MAG TPA: MTH1187 family thiamine-binding protein [Candidatus Bathyarchaeia archaeon]|nr:MTH1187 family thiamine-binding protein [Candidatus Bathyarchaeia archaeon]